MKANLQTPNEQIQNPQTPYKKPVDTKRSFSDANILVFILLGIILIGSILSYYSVTHKTSKKDATTPQNQKTETISSTPTEIDETEKLLVVNSHGSAIGKSSYYLTFQLKYPSKYFVTSDDMVTFYGTQGGMAPPRLIFTRDTQPLGEKTYWDVWNSGEDCIIVWSTTGFDSIEDFQNTKNPKNGSAKPPKIISKEEITILGGYQADKRVVKYSHKQSNNIDVFVRFPEDVAYFFQTCNMNSEKDLEILLNNLKIRADFFTKDLIPQENVIYLGTYLDQKALFFTNKKEKVVNQHVGNLMLNDGHGRSGFDYRELENPQRILVDSARSINSFNNFTLNTNQDIAYVSLNYEKEGEGPWPNLLNRILQINTDGSSAQEIWSNDIGSEKYNNSKGPAYLYQVINDRYIVLKIADCYGCEPETFGTIILNISTKAEKYYQMIGDVKIDVDNNTISYRKLETFQEPCPDIQNPHCYDGKIKEVRPTGQVFTDNLP